MIFKMYIFIYSTPLALIKSKVYLFVWQLEVNKCTT